MLWMACHGRLGTKDIEFSWGTVNNTSCVLCDGGDESFSFVFCVSFL